MTKVVLDTNVIVSAIAFRGKPREILELAFSYQIQAFISRFIIGEVCGVLSKKFSFSQLKTNQVEALLKNSFKVVEPKLSLNIIKNCPADNRILECGLAAKVDFLISGDKKHLLPLKKIKNILIVSPKEFLDYPRVSHFSRSRPFCRPGGSEATDRIS